MGRKPKCHCCGMKSNDKNDFQVVNSPPEHNLCGRCANNISLNPNSFHAERKLYNMEG